tara:strand:- start:2247 stop:2510 length:264 start_codon:yes stop_codon:yes gene_type:complete
MGTIQKFLSNKYNLWGIIALVNFLIGYIITPLVSGAEIFLIFFLLLVNNFCMLTWGMAQGIIAVTTMRDEFFKAMKKMRNYPKDDTE